jgi:hypothetical protein
VGRGVPDVRLVAQGGDAGIERVAGADQVADVDVVEGERGALGVLDELPVLLRRGPRRTKPREPRQRQRRLTAEQAAQFVSEYRAGTSMLQLAERWDIHRTTVVEHVHRAGVQVRQRGIPPQRLGDAVRPTQAGWSQPTCAVGSVMNLSNGATRPSRHGVAEY